MLALLAGGLASAYLIDQKKRETVFQRQNSVPVSYIASQYKPFNNPQTQNLVGCMGSYPAYNPNPMNPTYGYSTDPNYIGYVNQYYGNLQPYENVYRGPSSQGNPGPFNPLNPNLAFMDYEKNQMDRAIQLSEYNNFISKKKASGRNVEEGFSNVSNLSNSEGFSNVSNSEGFSNVDTNAPKNNGNKINRQINEIEFIPRDDFTFIPANDPTADYLLDTQNRPISDFTHNNMVPFFGAKMTQNMAGTGVQSGGYVDGVDVDSGYDGSTPYQGVLSNFTGIDDTYMHKREAGPMFSPAEQQTGYVYGAPLLRPEDSRYNVSITHRNDLAPCEPQMVGPGIDIDPSIPAQGGFHQFTRVMPNNVNDYKMNQLEGRINAGKLLTAELPTAYPGVGAGALNSNPNEQNGPGVTKNKPDTFYSQARLPTMTNRAGGVPTLNDEYRAEWNTDLKPKNGMKEQTSYGFGSTNLQQGIIRIPKNDGTQEYTEVCVDFDGLVGVGPLGATAGGLGPSRSPTYMSQDDNIRSVSDCNSLPMLGPSKAGSMGPEITNYYVNETGRGEINPLNEEQMNLRGSTVFNNTSFLDGAKTTMKETTDFSYSGDPNRPSAGSTFYTYADEPKTTMKETTEFAYSGDPNRPNAGSTFYTYADEPKTTMKETTEFAYSGDPNRTGVGSTFYTAENKPRPTVKQTTNYSYSGDPNKTGAGSTFYTAEDKPKPTVKQTTNYSYSGDPNKTSAGSTFYTAEDKPRPTIKQTTNFSYAGGAGDANKQETSRFQFTGASDGSCGENFGNVDYNKLRNDLKKGLVRTGGADTYTIRGSTLVENYVPTPGRQNIRQDAEQLMGKIDFGTFGYDEYLQGPGTYERAIPDTARLQNNRFMAVPHANPNKLFGIDDRQLAGYTVENLKNNPLSIYTDKPDSEIPKFFADNEPSNFASLVKSNSSLPTENIISRVVDYQKTLPNTESSSVGVSVYPKDNNPNKSTNDEVNPNALIVFNNIGTESYNPLIEQGSSRDPVNKVEFTGKAYSGKFENNSDRGVYGSINKMVKREMNDFGIEKDAKCASVNDMVCSPNKALSFADTLVIDRDLM